MGAIIAIDRIADAGLAEESGKVVEARTVYIVTETAAPVLQNALDTAGVPQPGEQLNTTNSDLKVSDRTCSVVASDGTTHTVRVEILYRLHRQTLEYPTRGGSTAQQITTQKDKNGNQITVEHDGKTQGGTITVFEPQSTFQETLVEETDNPDEVKRDWEAITNSNSYRGLGPRQWLITNIDYELVDEKSTPKKYQFTYEAQGSEITVDPEIAYVDEETGKIPPGLVEGTGIKTVQWYDAKDYATKFG